MDGQNWKGLKWIDFGKFEKRRPTFFQIYISLYQNVIYTAGQEFSVVLRPIRCGTPQKPFANSNGIELANIR